MTIDVHGSNGNGAHALELDFEAQLRDHADGLRQLLAREADEVQRLEQLLDEARTRAKRVQRSIDVLLGETPQTRSAQTKRAKSSSSPGQHGWNVSDAKVQRVWDAVRGRTDTFTQSAIDRELDGISSETVRKAVERLRELELLRIAGTSRGGGKMLAVMPNTSDIVDIAAYAA